MSAYLQWNDALAERFFNSAMAGRSVYLYVNDRLVSEMEQELGERSGTFLDAIKAGPPWATRQGTCQRAFQAFDSWRARGLPFPPYIAYLGLFVLASGTEGEFAPHAYYPRLRQCLGDPGSGMMPSFNLMWQLWDDLETWSVLDKGGELGIFRARIIGGHIHIGYPLAQSMLTEQERKALPRIFYDAGLDPTSTPPADELARALRAPGARGLLRPRTLGLLEKQYDADLYNAMLNTIADELAEWDGEVPDLPVGQGGRWVEFAGLRICLDLDTTVLTARATLRCKLNKEFPEEAVLLGVPGLPGKFRMEEYMEGWSLPIMDSETGEALDASRLSWRNGVLAKADSHGWQLRLAGRPVRVFEDGIPDGLPGVVETHALPRGQRFYLAFEQYTWPRIQRWVNSECRGFQVIENVKGLPANWSLARVTEATGDEGIRGEFPFLSFPPGTRLRLAGGIRSRRGNNFFSFAPPSVVLKGGTPGLAVYCNGERLVDHEQGGVFTLPQDLPLEARILIEVRDGSSVVARESLFLTGDFSLPSHIHASFAGYPLEGNSQEESAPVIVGAYVSGEGLEPDCLTRSLIEDVEAEIGQVTGFLVGRLPGQVIKLPARSLPGDWRPVWAIIKKGRRGQVVFLGDAAGQASPRREAGGDKRAVKRWKKAIWHNRRRTSPPRLRPLCELWKQYQEVARDV